MSACARFLHWPPPHTLPTQSYILTASQRKSLLHFFHWFLADVRGVSVCEDQLVHPPLTRTRLPLYHLPSTVRLHAHVQPHCAAHWLTPISLSLSVRTSLRPSSTLSPPCSSIDAPQGLNVTILNLTSRRIDITAKRPSQSILGQEA